MSYINREEAIRLIMEYQGGAMDKPTARKILEGMDGIEICKDTISRQALMKEFSDFVRASNSSDFAQTPTWNDAVSLVGSMPSAQPEQQWIPCSERLPEEEKKTYWVCTDAEYQCECRWTNNRFGIGEGEWGWSIFDTPQYTKPIAWMPLPEPYKEERKDDDE